MVYSDLFLQALEKRLALQTLNVSLTSYNFGSPVYDLLYAFTNNFAVAVFSVIKLFLQAEGGA